MRSDIFKTLKKVDKFLDSHALLLLAMLLVLALRIPNFYEPYWYGDEGIYLTIGQALNKGAKLYSEIVDHKTPIIYFLAQTGSQLNFRILNFVWMMSSTLLFYIFALKTSGRRLASGIAVILFVLFTSLPWFEGHIPNGELFVIGFMLLGAVLTAYTDYFSKLIKPKSKFSNGAANNLLLLAAGSSFGLGILTKVPALFDFAAFGAIGFFILANSLSFQPNQKNSWKKLLVPVIERWALLIAGTLVPILISIIYFVAQGSGADYLQYGLLYNFHYAGNWGLPFTNPVLLAAFTLQGKFILAAGLILAATIAKKFLSPAVQFLFAWFVLALFASLLSNRPYPHYFLQTFPPLCLMAGIALNYLIDLVRRKKQLSAEVFGVIGSTGLTIAIFGVVLLLLKVGVYPVKEYYSSWLQLRTGKISIQEYNRRFNYLMDDNYRASEIIRNSGEDKIFIWGTNPMLYAQSGASPVGKFTVAFHIKDLEVYQETMRAIIDEDPKYIVVMKAEGYNFPEFYTYLRANYRPFGTFDNYILWRKITNDANSR